MTAPRLGRHGLGGASLGNLYRAVDDDEAAALVAAAWNNGVRYFDTAPHYGAGLSEERLGRALAGRSREEFQLSTKVGRLLLPEEGPRADRADGGSLFVTSRPYRRVRDYTRDGVHRSIDDSLKRLGVDRLDVVFVHDPDDYMTEALDQAFPALDELRSQGVIGAYGAGMNSVPPLLRILEQTDSNCLMMAGCYNLLKHAEGAALLAAAQRRSVTVVLAGVFGSGLFALEKPREDAYFEYEPVPPAALYFARRVAGVATRYGATLPQVAVQFALRSTASTVCLGADSAAQVREHARLVDAALDGELWAELDAEGLILLDSGSSDGAEPRTSA